MGIRVALLALMAFLLTSCLPKPGHPVEWLHREDSIIVQMRTMGPATDEFARRLSVPEFTLYGDGTLLVTAAPGTSGQLRQARVSDGDVKKVLEFIDGTGFFNFNYTQPKLDVSARSTTYMYVALRNKANAVAAHAIDGMPGDGDAWSQFRKLQEIKGRLETLAADAVANRATTSYQPDAIVLTVQATPAIIVRAREWPFADIDLAAIAPDSGVGEQRLEGDRAREVEDWQQPFGKGFFLKNGIFAVAYRPALPYEENFPEFDAP